MEDKLTLLDESLRLHDGNAIIAVSTKLRVLRVLVSIQNIQINWIHT